MGQLAFVPGVAGSAATIGDGPYFPEARILDNPHRIFGGPYALTGPDDVSLFAQDRVDSGDPRLHFVVSFGGNPNHPIYVRSIEDGGIGYPITGLNGQWMPHRGRLGPQGHRGQQRHDTAVRERKGRGGFAFEEVGHDAVRQALLGAAQGCLLHRRRRLQRHLCRDVRGRRPRAVELRQDRVVATG
jgi:hypothetical protein